MRRLALLTAILMIPAMLRPAAAAGRQDDSTRNDRFPGSAVVAVGDSEYLIRIECRVQGSPEAGFLTEANRITRRETGGKYNMVSLRMRPWQDTEESIVSFEGYVAWIPTASSEAGVLSLTLDMAATTVVRDGNPVMVTYDMWHAGDRPAGAEGVRFEANCGTRDPAAPAYRKIRSGPTS
jgi:hypothetical protein